MVVFADATSLSFHRMFEFGAIAVLLLILIARILMR